MLFLHKLLPLIVLPLGWVAILLGLGIGLKRRWPMIAALVVLYLSSIEPLGSVLLRRLEGRFAMVPVAEASVVDAVVVLGGMLGPEVNPGYVPNMGEASERLEAGIALFHAKKAQYLVFTGGRIPWARRTEVEGAVLKRVAVARGVPDERILVTGEVGNTADEARLVKEVSDAKGFRTCLLVTTAWHMPRAARLFTKAGISIVPFPVDFRVDLQRKTTVLDFLPSGEGLARTEMALREWYGLAYYAVVGK